MEEDQFEVDDEFLPERIEPFAKMSQVAVNPAEKVATIPVKFRRNLFEDGSVLRGTPDEGTVSTDRQPMFYKPAHHMRAQPRVAYSYMDPEQRQQAEMLDTALARQQLLLRQQQELKTFAHRQQVEQQAQQLVNTSLAVGTSSTTPVNQQLQPQADRNKLNALLNEACILAPPSMGVVQQPGVNFLPGGVAWMPSQPVLSPQGYHNPVTVIGVPVMAPGAPRGFPAMGQEELMQAVRKELKRMQ